MAKKLIKRVSRKAAIIAAAGKQFEITSPLQLVKANAMDRRVFIYALKKTPTRFAVLFKEVNLPSGMEWKLLGNAGRYLIYVSV